MPITELEGSPAATLRPVAANALRPAWLSRAGWPAQLLLGVALAAVAVVLRWLVDPVLGSRQPYTPAYGLVAVAVWFGGWRAALVTLVVCHVASTYFFVAPRGQWTWSSQELVGSATYYLIGAVIVFLGHRATTANRALSQALVLLRESDQRRLRFLAVLAHELRNPLAAIGPAVELLASERIDAAQRRAMGGIAQRQLAQMRHLIDDLMDVSRIDQGRIRLQRRRLAVADVVTEACAAARVFADPRGQTIRASAPEGGLAGIAVDGDALRLNQVLVNLLQNAVKFSPQGALIELLVRIDAAMVVLTVRDHGIGIPPASLESIFEPFVQVEHGTHQGDGVGLGLSLVKAVVQLHGGQVLARSPGPGQGAEFELRLPRAPDLA